MLEIVKMLEIGNIGIIMNNGNIGNDRNVGNIGNIRINGNIGLMRGAVKFGRVPVDGADHPARASSSFCTCCVIEFWN